MPVNEGRPAMKITALAAGFVMAGLDATVMQVAGATIQERLNASLTQLTWAVDGYVLTFAALLMLAGGLADRVGARTVYLWGMAIFVAASLASALAPTIELLIAARLLQGAGAALFMPSSLALLVHAFPDPRERTRVLGLWSAIVSSSVALGPTVGGIMVSALGWQSIFLINLPVGLLGMTLTRRFVARADAGQKASLAVPGHATLIVALAALSFALIEGPQRGWTSAAVLAAAATTVIATALLLVRERRARTTVMPWTLFRGPRFAGANAVGFLFNAAFYGVLFLVGLYFQHARGASPLRAGLEILPLTVFLPLSNITFARISARFANGPLLSISLLVAAAASLAMAAISPATPYWQVALALAVTGIAGGIISPAMTAAMVDAAGPENGNVAGAVLNANRQVGTLVGIAVIGAMLAAAPDWTTGTAEAFLAIGIAYLVATVAAWRLIAKPERRAALVPAGPATAQPTPALSRH
ncbi:MFS transporter [Spirillospora sp. NPDC048911]|uniref:MFS transporter n=1 Tax=Spirillospora sp. NPDC048911 TaxID=3364527 RepID=UPI003715F232